MVAGKQEHRNKTKEDGKREMWNNMDEIMIKVAVDKNGILGQIAKIISLAEKLNLEIAALARMLSGIEKSSASSDTEGK